MYQDDLQQELSIVVGDKKSRNMNRKCVKTIFFLYIKQYFKISLFEMSGDECILQRRY